MYQQAPRDVRVIMWLVANQRVRAENVELVLPHYAQHVVIDRLELAAFVHSSIEVSQKLGT